MTDDRIDITSLSLVASVGVLPEEHEREQPLEISLSVEVDLTAAGASDDLVDTVNYAELIDIASSVAASMHHKLLESLADEIGRAALDVDSRIEAITVSVTKLRPPVPAHVDTVGVQRRVSR